MKCIKLLICFFTLAILTACGGSTSDLQGTWKQKGATEDAWHEAVIIDDYMEIYWVSDGGDTRMLYWAGSYSEPQKTDGGLSWTSEVDKDNSGTSWLTSVDDTKVFNYNNGEISYNASALGATTTMRLNRISRDGSFVYGGKSNKFNQQSEGGDATDKESKEELLTIDIGGVEFSVPGRYVIDTETDSIVNLLYEQGSNQSNLVFRLERELDFILRENEVDEFVSEKIKELGDVRRISKDSLSVKGGKGYIYHHEFNEQGEQGTVDLAFLMRHNENAIIVLYACVGEEMENHEENFKTILESAKWPETVTKGSTKESTESANDTGSNEVTPSFKETMDKYEAFFDEYVAFMKSYQENPMNALSMLNEYTDMLTKYTEFYTEMSQLNTSDLPPADLAYYIEVTARIEKKLLEVVDY